MAKMTGSQVMGTMTMTFTTIYTILQYLQVIFRVLKSFNDFIVKINIYVEVHRLTMYVRKSLLSGMYPGW